VVPFSTRPIRRGLAPSILAVIVSACGPGDAGPALPTAPPKPRGDAKTNLAIQERLNAIVNDAEIRYKPLKYEYEEGLLKIVDQVEASLSGKPGAAPPRFMPQLDEAEERDHFRETIRRWEEQGGRSFRAAIDPLIAEVAGRKPGEAIDLDFHKRFGAVFDSFVPIEVKEARERQNRAIHASAESLLAPYRAAQPESVKDFEEMLKQQYPLVTPPPSRKS
jgi:hypothetical protein